MDKIAVFIIPTVLDVIEGIFAVLYVSLMGLTRFYKTVDFTFIFAVFPTNLNIFFISSVNVL